MMRTTRRRLPPMILGLLGLAGALLAATRADGAPMRVEHRSPER